MRIKHNKGLTSYVALLIKAVFASRGPVAEVGAGFYSTPLLHWICKSLNRKLVTYENKSEFYKFAKKFQSRLHVIRFVENWDNMDFKRHWGVVFIDHDPPQRRGIDVINFKDTADYIVMHDTNPPPPDDFNYNMVWPHFKYKYDWTEYSSWTSVVSNFFDVSKWDNNILHFL